MNKKNNLGAIQFLVVSACSLFVAGIICYEWSSLLKVWPVLLLLLAAIAGLVPLTIHSFLDWRGGENGTSFWPIEKAEKVEKEGALAGFVSLLVVFGIWLLENRFGLKVSDWLSVAIGIVLCPLVVFGIGHAWWSLAIRLRQTCRS